MVQQDQQTHREAETLALCRQRADALRLDMKIIRVEFNFDGSSLLVYFTSEQRVDFRGLVHDLAQVLLERARTVGERAGFSAELLQRGAPHPLDAEIQRQAIYICREAINNIEKHSRCSKVALEIAWGEQALEVTVADNGRGFDLEQVDQRGHYGLTIMKERAAIVGGTLEVFSTPGESSTIALSLPYTPGRAPAAAVLNLQDAPEPNLQADLAGPRPPSTPAGKV